MKRWRKQTRVNGVVVETLRLRNFNGSSDRGVMISLQLTHEKNAFSLTIEVDGDAPISSRNEGDILKEAERLLQDAIILLQPLGEKEPMSAPTISLKKLFLLDEE